MKSFLGNFYTHLAIFSGHTVYHIPRNVNLNVAILYSWTYYLQSQNSIQPSGVVNVAILHQGQCGFEWKALKQVVVVL